MEWVVFDYAGVLSHPPSDQAGALLAAEFGVPPDRFWAAYWRDRDAYDRAAVDAATYWHTVAGHLDRPTPADLDRLTGLDVRAWLDLNAGTMAVLEELAARGIPLALLSNAPVALARSVDAQPWAALFRHRFFSADLRHSKPDRRIFETVCQSLGVTPPEVLFVDDRTENVAAAAALGMHAVHFTDADRLRTDLVAT